MLAIQNSIQNSNKKWMNHKIMVKGKIFPELHWLADKFLK
jgi:hypothetical protein